MYVSVCHVTYRFPAKMAGLTSFVSGLHSNDPGSTPTWVQTFLATVQPFIKLLRQSLVLTRTPKHCQAAAKPVACHTHHPFQGRKWGGEEKERSN